MKIQISKFDLGMLERQTRLFKYLHLEEPQPPFKMIITPTDRCNLNCFFCPNFVGRLHDRFEREKELSTEEWLGVIEDGLKMDVRLLCFLGGGEPLLRKEIFSESLDLIRKKFQVFGIELITNGILFDKKLIEKFVEISIEKGILTQVTISIHGKNTYKEITGFDLYEKARENIKYIIESKKKLNSSYPIVQINTVVNKKNLNEIHSLVEELASLPVDQIALHPLHIYEETKDVIKNYIPSREEYKEIIENVPRLKEKFKKITIDTLSLTSYIQQIHSEIRDEIDAKVSVEVERDLRFEPFKFLNYRCFEPWYDILINPDGKVARCAAFVVRDEPINVKNQSLKEIWFGDYLNKIRENVKKDILMIGCSPCALKSNTITLKKELKEFIENELKFDVNNLKKIENKIKEMLKNDAKN